LLDGAAWGATPGRHTVIPRHRIAQPLANVFGQRERGHRLVRFRIVHLSDLLLLLLLRRWGGWPAFALHSATATESLLLIDIITGLLYVVRVTLAGVGVTWLA